MPTEPNSNTHPVNVTHLVMGLAFLGAVGLWWLMEYDLVSSSSLRWLIPLPWLVAGAAGLAAIAFSRRRDRTKPVSYADDVATTGEPHQPTSPDQT